MLIMLCDGNGNVLTEHADSAVQTLWLVHMGPSDVNFGKNQQTREPSPFYSESN